MELTIAEIERACGGRLAVQGAEAGERVTSVAIDSRRVTEGGVFAAAPGARVDGHRFIGQVFERGASLVLTQKEPEQVEKEHGVDPRLWGSYLLVEDTYAALRRLAEYYRGKLSIPVVGITGSVGKTSTKELIAGVLSVKYNVLKTEGNYNNEIGVPLTLLRIRPEHTAAVVEMGISDFGEMHRLSRMARPDVCVITNIGQSHLESLKTRDGILRAKSEMFDYMAPEAEVCLNGEDDKLAAVTQVVGRQTRFFGLGGNEAEEVYITDVTSRGLRGSDCILHLGGASRGDRTYPLHISAPGAHMVMNGAAAACVATCLGLTPEQICAGLGRVKAVSGRDELFWLPKYTLIDSSYNANPVSMEAAIDLLALGEGVKTAVLGDMFELGEESDSMHAQVGAYAAGKGIDRIVCVGERSRQMFEAARREARRGQQAFYFAHRQELIELLEREPGSLVSPGGCVLVKASHGMEFKEIADLLKN